MLSVVSSYRVSYTVMQQQSSGHLFRSSRHRAISYFEEDKQADKRDKGEDSRQVNQPIEAPDLREDAPQPVAEQLPKAQEHRIETHEQTSIPGSILGDVGKVGQRSGREAALGKDAHEQQRDPYNGPEGIARRCVVQSGQGYASQVDAGDRGEHEQQARRAIHEESPEEQAEAKEEHVNAQHEAEMPASAPRAEAAHQKLTSDVARRREDEGELRT